MSTCRDGRSTAAARVTAMQARDASKYFSVAPYQVLSCLEYAGTLCYLSRLVYGLPTFYWEEFVLFPKFPQKNLGITQTQTSKWCGLSDSPTLGV
jgi:hypothetical protein